MRVADVWWNSKPEKLKENADLLQIWNAVGDQSGVGRFPLQINETQGRGSHIVQILKETLKNDLKMLALQKNDLKMLALQLFSFEEQFCNAYAALTFML